MIKQCSTCNKGEKVTDHYVYCNLVNLPKHNDMCCLLWAAKERGNIMFATERERELYEMLHNICDFIEELDYFRPGNFEMIPGATRDTAYYKASKILDLIEPITERLEEMVE